MSISTATIDEILQRLAGRSGGDSTSDGRATAIVRDCGNLRPDGQGVIVHRFDTAAPIADVRRKLTGFPHQWFGQTFRNDEHGLVFRIAIPTSFWQQLRGKRAGLDTTIRLAPAAANDAGAAGTEVAVSIRPLRGDPASGRKLVSEIGPEIIASLRLLLACGPQEQANEKRGYERQRWPSALKVTPLHADGSHGTPVAGCGKDISESGLGFYVPHKPATADVLIELPDHPQAIVVPAHVVRVKRCADGWYEAGALFRS